MAPSVKRRSLDFSSSLDLEVVSSGPALSSTLGVELNVGMKDWGKNNPAVVPNPCSSEACIEIQVHQFQKGSKQWQDDRATQQRTCLETQCRGGARLKRNVNDSVDALALSSCGHSI